MLYKVAKNSTQVKVAVRRPHTSSDYGSQIMALPTLPDIGRHPDLKMSATKPVVEKAHSVQKAFLYFRFTIRIFEFP